MAFHDGAAEQPDPAHTQLSRQPVSTKVARGSVSQRIQELGNRTVSIRRATLRQAGWAACAIGLVIQQLPGIPPSVRSGAFIIGFAGAMLLGFEMLVGLVRQEAAQVFTSMSAHRSPEPFERAIAEIQEVQDVSTRVRRLVTGSIEELSDWHGDARRRSETAFRYSISFFGVGMTLVVAGIALWTFRFVAVPSEAPVLFSGAGLLMNVIGGVLHHTFRLAHQQFTQAVADKQSMQRVMLAEELMAGATDPAKYHELRTIIVRGLIHPTAGDQSDPQKMNQ